MVTVHSLPNSFLSPRKGMGGEEGGEGRKGEGGDREGRRAKGGQEEGGEEDTPS